MSLSLNAIVASTMFDTLSDDQTPVAVCLHCTEFSVVLEPGQPMATWTTAMRAHAQDCPKWPADPYPRARGRRVVDVQLPGQLSITQDVGDVAPGASVTGLIIDHL